MQTIAKTKITVETTVKAPVERVWKLWTEPWHILHWNSPSIDWHTTYSENDFRVGGRLLSRMESVDGKDGFDFSGEYTNIELYKHIDYVIADGRRVWVSFEDKGNSTRVAEIFEAESENSPEFQQEGWQAILDNFGRYTESYKEDDLHYEILISCKPDKLFKTITGEDTFKEWTKPFNPSSYFNGSWKKGSKIEFLGTDKNGNKSGMVSRIRENISGKFISIEHMGIIEKGIEITCGPDVDDWQGAMENYTLIPIGNKTNLVVDADAAGEFGEMGEIWPQALDKLKEVCERN